MRRLCEGLPPVQGLVKSVPEDFVVEERPAYLPSGEGEHLYLWVEKRGLSTQDVVSALARALGLRPGEVGAAGQKDRQAVTRQWLSVPAAAVPGALPEGEGWRILESRRHGNKLRTGHLKGNRFGIRLRGAGAAEAEARAILARLEATGVPNYYGPQRFGRGGDNAEGGRALLEGRRRARGRFERRMLLSALQSALFNDWLDARIDDGLLGAALEGDLLQVRESGGVFWCDDPAVDGPRVAVGEVDPTGPIFGHRMRRPRGEALAREDRVLAAADLTIEAFAAGGRDTQGARRPARVPLGEAEVRSEGADLWVGFALPSGAYATVVLAELTGSS